MACDVTTPFLDAPALFGPQKGASPDDGARARGAAGRARRALPRRDVGVDVRTLTGAGAAGGLAGGLAALGARLVPGFDVVADAVGFDAALAASGAVITGEGKVDRSTLSGKVVARVLDAARRRGVAAAVVAGRVEPGVDLGGAPVQALSELGGDSFRDAAALAEQAAFSLASRL